MMHRLSAPSATLVVASVPVARTSRVSGIFTDTNNGLNIVNTPMARAAPHRLERASG